MTPLYKTVFDTRNDLDKYKENALALFALQLRFQIEDIETVAANSLTGGGDDKKCDVIYVNKDAGYVVVIQTYMAQNLNKAAAPANKASDLNTAATWLLNSSIDELPEGLRSAAGEVRSEIDAGSIRFVHFWYVHNLPESENVKNELRMVEQTISNALKHQYPNSEMDNVSALEVGQETLDEWYKVLENPILVTNNIPVPIYGGYTISGSDWQAFVASVPIKWLHTLFKTHTDNLFSANVRSYLGSRRSTDNINHGIKTTAKNDPNHFWVYNNGITALVLDFKESNSTEEKNEYNTNKNLDINGISIVNGAQTTGALGSLEAMPNDEGKVQVRFVKCDNKNTVRSIIEYNNRQNVVEASDFRSNDSIQRRLCDEFTRIPNTTYNGGRRGGSKDVIRRPSNLLPSDTAAQTLAAFHQDPVLAYNSKSDIWTIDKVYSKYFSEQTSAVHIVFAYSLLRCVEAKKLLLQSYKKNSSLPEAEAQQLEVLERRGANFLLTSAVAKCLEIFLARQIPNTFRVSFKEEVSPEDAQKIWEPIVDVTSAFCKYLLPAVQKSLKSNEEASNAIGNFKDIINSTKKYHEPTYKEFEKNVIIRT